MRRTMFTLVVMGITLALAAGVALAQGAETSRGSVEFVLNAEDCAGETILVTGKLNSVFHVTEDEETGRIHVNTHFNFADTQGVGEVTGLKYRIPTTINSVQFLTSAGQLIATDVSLSNVIGVGQVPNQQATAVVHFVVNGDGTVMSEVAHFRFECRQ